MKKVSENIGKNELFLSLHRFIFISSVTVIIKQYFLIFTIKLIIKETIFNNTSDYSK